MSEETPESKYGKEGTQYSIGEDKIFINMEFVISTLMGVIVVMRDILGKDFKSENGLDIDQIVERIAQQLYDQITPNN
jgi:hypothetical protein